MFEAAMRGDRDEIRARDQGLTAADWAQPR